MTIETPNDIFGALEKATACVDLVADPYKTALSTALAMASPVDRICYGIEALYAAVKTDAAMTASTASSVATAVAQLAYLIHLNQWHGKADRAAEMGSVMNAIVDGAAPSSIAGAPAVDQQFQQAIIP
jgi:hypothetical protein